MSGYYTNGTSSTADFSIEKVKEALREMENLVFLEKATHFIVEHPTRPQIDMFSADEFPAFANGEKTPDFIDDFRRWFAVQLVRKGAVKQVLAMDHNTLRPAWEMPEIQMPEFDPIEMCKMRMRYWP